MKRLAMAAFLLLAATSARTEAGSLPKPKSVIDRETPGHQTPYVRGTRKLPNPARYGRSTTQGDLHQTHSVRGK